MAPPVHRRARQRDQLSLLTQKIPGGPSSISGGWGPNSNWENFSWLSCVQSLGNPGIQIGEAIDGTLSTSSGCSCAIF